MSLPHNALVLVADGRKMLFLRNRGDEAHIDLRTEAHDERADAKDSDMRADAPGTNHQSVGFARSSYQETDSHQQAEDDWVKDAGEELNKRALANDFEHLCIIAPPKALGVLRKYLHKEVERRIFCTINKEMKGRPTSDIEALIVNATKAEGLAEV